MCRLLGLDESLSEKELGDLETEQWMHSRVLSDDTVVTTTNTCHTQREFLELSREDKRSGDDSRRWRSWQPGIISSSDNLSSESNG